MASIQPSTRDVYSNMREMHWSPKEKAIARRVFDRALHQELDETIRGAKRLAERIERPDELWVLERHLTQRRKQIDAKYEFKYSSVLLLLAELIRESRIGLDELHGLSEDKLKCVRDHSRYSAA